MAWRVYSESEGRDGLEVVEESAGAKELWRVPPRVLVEVLVRECEMRLATRVVCFGFAVAWSLFGAGLRPSCLCQDAQRPNFIVISIDDLGYADIVLLDRRSIRLRTSTAWPPKGSD